MNAVGRKCVWCGSPANSKENVFPQWLRKFDGPSKYIAEHGGYQDSTPRLVVKRDKDGRWVEYEATRGDRTPTLHEVQVKVVCDDCNTIWMSQLEEAAKPIIRRLTQGDGIDLSMEDARTLANWAHKTFLMYDLWEAVRDRRYRSRDYQTFYTDRIPYVNVRLYLAYSPAATFGMWGDSRCVIPAGVDRHSYMDTHSPNCGASFFAVDGLVIIEHWFSPDYPSRDRLGRSIRTASHRKMRKLGAQEIWPRPQELRGWPRRELDLKEVICASLRGRWIADHRPATRRSARRPHRCQANV